MIVTAGGVRRSGPVQAGGIWAILPLKRTDLAKQRLSAALTPAQRQRLAFAMFQDVLSALAASPSLAGIAVVTEDADAAGYATGAGCRVMTAGAADGHTGAVIAATVRLAAEGCRTILTVPGDIPLVTVAEIETVLASQHGRPACGPVFAIVPAHDGRGSNAIMMSPPDCLPLRFGDDSFHPHCAMAAARGIEPAVRHLPGIGLDIDTPADLARFLAVRSDTRAWSFLSGEQGPRVRP